MVLSLIKEIIWTLYTYTSIDRSKNRPVQIYIRLYSTDPTHLACYSIPNFRASTLIARPNKQTSH